MSKPLDEMHRGHKNSGWVLDADGTVPRVRERSTGMASSTGTRGRRIDAATAIPFAVAAYRPRQAAEVDALYGAAQCAGVGAALTV